MDSGKAVVFDLGRVLVDYDYTRLFGFFARHGLRVGDEADLMARCRLADYECGHLDDDAFFDGLARLMPVSPPMDELRARWLGLFSPADPMLDYARSLGGRTPVYILSNVSTAHFEHLRQAYGLDALADDILTSCEAGCLKPDPAIYRAAQDRFGVAPDTVLFVDDKAENVEGARQCGWAAIHHTDAVATMAHIDRWLAS